MSQIVTVKSFKNFFDAGNGGNYILGDEGTLRCVNGKTKATKTKVKDSGQANVNVRIALFKAFSADYKNQNEDLAKLATKLGLSAKGDEVIDTNLAERKLSVLEVKEVAKQFTASQKAQKAKDKKTNRTALAAGFGRELDNQKIGTEKLNVFLRNVTCKGFTKEEIKKAPNVYELLAKKYPIKSIMRSPAYSELEDMVVNEVKNLVDKDTASYLTFMKDVLELCEKDDTVAFFLDSVMPMVTARLQGWFDALDNIRDSIQDDLFEKVGVGNNPELQELCKNYVDEMLTAKMKDFDLFKPVHALNATTGKWVDKKVGRVHTADELSVMAYGPNKTKAKINEAFGDEIAPIVEELQSQLQPFSDAMKIWLEEKNKGIKNEEDLYRSIALAIVRSNSQYAAVNLCANKFKLKTTEIENSIANQILKKLPGAGNLKKTKASANLGALDANGKARLFSNFRQLVKSANEQFDTVDRLSKLSAEIKISPDDLPNKLSDDSEVTDYERDGLRGLLEKESEFVKQTQEQFGNLMSVEFTAWKPETHTLDEILRKYEELHAKWQDRLVIRLLDYRARLNLFDTGVNEKKEDNSFFKVVPEADRQQFDSLVKDARKDLGRQMRNGLTSISAKTDDEYASWSKTFEEEAERKRKALVNNLFDPSKNELFGAIQDKALSSRFMLDAETEIGTAVGDVNSTITREILATVNKKIDKKKTYVYACTGSMVLPNLEIIDGTQLTPQAWCWNKLAKLVEEKQRKLTKLAADAVKAKKYDKKGITDSAYTKALKEFKDEKWLKAEIDNAVAEWKKCAETYEKGCREIEQRVLKAFKGLPERSLKEQGSANRISTFNLDKSTWNQSVPEDCIKKSLELVRKHAFGTDPAYKTTDQLQGALDGLFKEMVKQMNQDGVKRWNKLGKDLLLAKLGQKLDALNKELKKAGQGKGKATPAEVVALNNMLAWHQKHLVELSNALSGLANRYKDDENQIHDLDVNVELFLDLVQNAVELYNHEFSYLAEARRKFTGQTQSLKLRGLTGLMHEMAIGLIDQEFVAVKPAGAEPKNEPVIDYDKMFYDVKDSSGKVTYRDRINSFADGLVTKYVTKDGKVPDDKQIIKDCEDFMTDLVKEFQQTKNIADKKALEKDINTAKANMVDEIVNDLAKTSVRDLNSEQQDNILQRAGKKVKSYVLGDVGLNVKLGEVLDRGTLRTIVAGAFDDIAKGKLTGKATKTDGVLEATRYEKFDAKKMRTEVLNRVKADKNGIQKTIGAVVELSDEVDRFCEHYGCPQLREEYRTELVDGIANKVLFGMTNLKSKSEKSKVGFVEALAGELSAGGIGKKPNANFKKAVDAAMDIGNRRFVNTAADESEAIYTLAGIDAIVVNDQDVQNGTGVLAQLKKNNNDLLGRDTIKKVVLRLATDYYNELEKNDGTPAKGGLRKIFKYDPKAKTEIAKRLKAWFEKSYAPAREILRYATEYVRKYNGQAQVSDDAKILNVNDFAGRFVDYLVGYGCVAEFFECFEKNPGSVAKLSETWKERVPKAVGIFINNHADLVGSLKKSVSEFETVTADLGLPGSIKAYQVDVNEANDIFAVKGEDRALMAQMLKVVRDDFGCQKLPNWNSKDANAAKVPMCRIFGLMFPTAFREAKKLLKPGEKFTPETVWKAFFGNTKKYPKDASDLGKSFLTQLYTKAGKDFYMINRDTNIGTVHNIAFGSNITWDEAFASWNDPAHIISPKGLIAHGVPVVSDDNVHLSLVASFASEVRRDLYQTTLDEKTSKFKTEHHGNEPSKSELETIKTEVNKYVNHDKTAQKRKTDEVERRIGALSPKEKALRVIERFNLGADWIRNFSGAPDEKKVLKPTQQIKVNGNVVFDTKGIAQGADAINGRIRSFCEEQIDGKADDNLRLPGVSGIQLAKAFSVSGQTFDAGGYGCQFGRNFGPGTRSVNMSMDGIAGDLIVDIVHEPDLKAYGAIPIRTEMQIKIDHDGKATLMNHVATRVDKKGKGERVVYVENGMFVDTL